MIQNRNFLIVSRVFTPHRKIQKHLISVRLKIGKGIMS